MSGFEKLLLNRTIAERYRIERFIGRGGMGVVYQAQDQRLCRPIAIKLLSIPDQLSDDTNLRRRFLREARTAARFHHPHIVQIYDFGTDAVLDFDYLVMELLTGEDLGATLKREGALSPMLVRKYMLEAAEGLAEGHSHGIVHRDVKPSNLFLARRGRSERILLLDFGIAQLPVGSEETQSHLTRVGSVPHSPAFASPEQQAGDSHLTPASDVYSLGVTALALLSGAPPGRPWAALYTELGPYAAEARASGLLSVIDLCVRRNRAERLSDGASVVEALEHLLGSTPAPRHFQDTPRTSNLDSYPESNGRSEAASPDAWSTQANSLAPAESKSKPTPAFKRSIRTRTLIAAIAATWLAVILWNVGLPHTALDEAPVTQPAVTSVPEQSVPVTTSREQTSAESSSKRGRRERQTNRADGAQHPPSSPTPPALVDSGKTVREEPIAPAIAVQREEEAVVMPELINRADVNKWMSRHYPSLLRDAGVTGTVMLSVCIAADGSVEPGSITVQTSTHEAFATSAIQAVGRMRFRPATLHGVPTRRCVTVPVTYNLET